MNITLQDLIELKESIGADSVRLSVHSGMPLQDPVVRLEVRRFESDAPQKVVGSKLVPCDDNLTAIVLARQIDPDWRNLCLPARGYLANLFAAFPRRSHAGNMARLSVRAAKEPRSCPAFF